MQHHVYTKTYEKYYVLCVKWEYIFIYLFYFYLTHNNYKNLGEEEKKKWRRDLTETKGAYERLGLLELRARAVSHQLKKRWRKVEDGKIKELFSYLLNNLIFIFFLKKARDWELMTSLSRELKKLRPLIAWLLDWYCCQFTTLSSRQIEFPRNAKHSIRMVIIFRC